MAEPTHVASPDLEQMQALQDETSIRPAPRGRRSSATRRVITSDEPESTSSEGLRQSTSTSVQPYSRSQDTSGKKDDCSQDANIFEDDPDPEEHEIWEGVTTRAQRRTEARAQRQTNVVALRSTNAMEHEHLGAFVLNVRPKGRWAILSLDPRRVKHLIDSLAGDSKLLEHQLIRYNRASNTITVHTCDSHLVCNLKKLTSLVTLSEQPLQVSVYEMPADGISQGVIYDCCRKKTVESLVPVLKCESADILAARPMERNAVILAVILIPFASPRPPFYVKYIDTLKRVCPYEQRSLVCSRCHTSRTCAR